MSPSLFVLSCPFECNNVAFEFFSSILLVYLSFCLQYFHAKVGHECLKTWPIHRCFLCQIEFSICPSSFTLLTASSLVTLSSQLIFSILLHFHISKASNLLSVCIRRRLEAFEMWHDMFKVGQFIQKHG